MITFKSTEDFPELKVLEENFETIKEEFSRLNKELFVPYTGYPAVDDNWVVFGLKVSGYESKRNAALCPKTVELLNKIPGAVLAGFVTLKPGTHLPRHRGYSDKVLRFHMGIEVPEPESCALVVESELKRWQEGVGFIWDDTKLREAWNLGEKPRTILWVDIVKNPEDEKLWSEHLHEFEPSVVNYAEHLF